MKLKRLGQAAAVLSIAALGLTACGQANNPGASSSGAASGSAAEGGSQAEGTLSGSGATSQEAAVTAWQTGLAATAPNVTVQYNPVGSGAGRKAFLAGSASFAGSDAALKPEEQDEAKKVCGPDGALNIPAYIAPVSVAYNLKGVDKVQMDAETIASIFTGKINKWNDPALVKQNEGVSLPDTKITVVHRSDESGTTKNFTDYLTAAAPKAWTYDVVEKWPSEINAESAQGTSGVVKLATTTDGAITYADLAATGNLGHVSVKVGDTYQEPTEEAAAKTVETAKKVEGGSANDMAVKLDRTATTAGTYPIVLVSYHIFCSTYKDQNTVDMVKAFGTYVTSQDGQKAAQEAAGAAPLSTSLSDQAKKSIETITVAK